MTINKELSSLLFSFMNIEDSRVWPALRTEAIVVDYNMLQVLVDIIQLRKRNRKISHHAKPCEQVWNLEM
jgi:hypothetical protein